MNRLPYLNFMAMRRSGHHAVLFWMVEQMLARQIWVMIDARPQKVNVGWVFNKDTKRCLEPDENPLMILNIEDRYYENLGGPTILVMRSIENNVASRLKGKEMANPSSIYFGEMQATAYDTYRRMAEAVLNEEVDLFVYYDKWFTDKEYRRRLIEKLHLIAPAEFTDEGLNNVNKLIPGSSFDAHKYDAKAQQMQVLTRHKQVGMPRIPADVLELSKQVAEKANE